VPVRPSGKGIMQTR